MKTTTPTHTEDLSFSQQNIWNLEQALPHTPINHISVSYTHLLYTICPSATVITQRPIAHQPSNGVLLPWETKVFGLIFSR